MHTFTLKWLGLGLMLFSLTTSAKPAAVRRPNSEELPPANVESVSPEMEKLQNEVKKMQIHFNNAASNAARERLLKGGIFLGATGFLLGVYIAEDRLNAGEPAVVAKGVVGVTGVLFGMGGIATLLISDATEESGERYRSFAGKSEKQLRDKLLLGEGELRRYAERAKLNRRLVGGGFLTVGVANFVWFLGTGSNPSLNFLPYLGGLYSVLGGLMLTFDSAAEMEYQSFLADREYSRPFASTKLSLFPTLHPDSLTPQLGLALHF